MTPNNFLQTLHFHIMRIGGLRRPFFKCQTHSLLRNPKNNHLFHKIRPLASILDLLTQVHIPTLLEILFNIIIPPTFRSPKRSLPLKLSYLNVSGILSTA